MVLHKSTGLYLGHELRGLCSLGSFLFNFTFLTCHPEPHPVGGGVLSPAASFPASAKAENTSGSRHCGVQWCRSSCKSASVGRMPSEPGSAGPPQHSRMPPPRPPPASRAGSMVQTPPCPPLLWPVWSERDALHCACVPVYPLTPADTVLGGYRWHIQSWGCRVLALLPLSSSPGIQTAGGQQWERAVPQILSAGHRKVSRSQGHGPKRSGLRWTPAHRCHRCLTKPGLCPQVGGLWWVSDLRSPTWPKPLQGNTLQTWLLLSGLKQRRRNRQRV